MKFINDNLESDENLKPYLVNYEFFLDGVYYNESTGIFAHNLAEAINQANMWADIAEFNIISVSPIAQED